MNSAGRILLLACVVLLAAPRASADTLSSSRYELTENFHEVSVVVDRGSATLVVRRTVANPGPRGDQALFWIEVPTVAVATRLRTSGVDAAGQRVWFEGDLMDAEEAAAKYRELTGIGGYYPKDPALLSWRQQGTLALQVFPVPARGSKTVEYTLEMPTHYEAGAYHMLIPPLGTTERPAVVRVVAAHPQDQLRINGVEATSASVDAKEEIAIELRPAAAPRLSGALAEIGLGGDRVLFHGRADAAPRLGQVPSFAAIAVVLDTSRSMGERLDASVAAARAYLSSFPAAEVTVVTFDRRVGLPFGSAIPLPDALARMQAFAPPSKNGSRLDDAVLRADAVLASSKASARRMVVVTDLLTRAAFTPAKLAALSLRSGATVHVATIDPGASATLRRDDDDAWASFPRKTGGVLWRGEVGGVDSAARGVFEEWARPKRIDHLKVTGFPDQFTPSDVLEEGTGLEYLGIAKKRTWRVSLEGELWSRPVKFEEASTPGEERRWSALVFGSPLLYDLSEDEQRLLALKGRAVSPVTSYLAIEPGVRPSIDGLEEFGAGGLGLAGVGEGGFGSGTGTAAGAAGPTDLQGFLSREMGRAWKRCGAAGEVDVDLESTRAEVVEVGDVTLSRPSAAAESCMREAAWALDLPATFAAAHASWRVHAGG